MVSKSEYCYIKNHNKSFDFLDRSPLSPSGVGGSHALPSPVSPATTGATLTTPTKKTHQRSKSDATAAITASTRLMQVSGGGGSSIKQFSYTYMCPECLELSRFASESEILSNH